MIEAYLDESGVHDQANVCVIAGYFGALEPMRKLERAWKRVLKSFDFPMERFHAKILVKSRQYEPMLKKLAKTIGKQRGVHPVSYGIIVGDFNSFSLNQRKFLTGATLHPKSGKFISTGCANKPYFVPFQSVVKLVTGYAPIRGKAHFSFGVDRPFGDFALSLHKQMIAHAHAPSRPWSTWKSRKSLGTIQFPLASETAPLQAADLLAHLTYLHMKEWIAKGKVALPSDILTECITNTRSLSDHKFQDRACLEKVLEQARRYVPNAQI